MSKIPFGKPFPGIDSVSLRDGVASGLVNGFINETGVDVESIPGQAEFTVLQTVTEPETSGVSRFFNGSASNYLYVNDGTFMDRTAQCAWIKVSSLNYLGTIFGNRYDAGYAFQINASNQLQISWQTAGTVYTMTAPLTIAGGASIDYLQVGVPLFVAINVTHNDSLTPPVTADFYAGLTAASVALIGSASVPGQYMPPNGVQKIIIGGNNFGMASPTAPTFDPFFGYMDRVGRWSGKNLTLAEWQEVAYADGVLPALVGGEILSFFFEMTGDDPEPNSNTLAVDAVVQGSLPTSDGLADTSRLAPIVGALTSIDGLYETIEGVVLAVSNGHVFMVNADQTFIQFTGDLLEVGTYPYWAEDGHNVFISHGGKIARLDMELLTVDLLNQNSPNHVTHIARAKGFLLCNGDDFLGSSAVFDLVQVFDNSASLTAVAVLHDRIGWMVAGGQGTFSVDDNAGRLYLSKDNGVTWARVFNDPNNNQFNTVEYMGNGVVLAGTAFTTGEVFRSADYGQTWTDMSAAPIATNINFIRKLTDTIVIAGTGDGPGLGRVFRSVDAGLNWVDVGTFGTNVTAGEPLTLDGSIVEIAVQTSTPSVEIWRSTDFGASFTSIGGTFTGANLVTFIQRITDLISVFSNGFTAGTTNQKIWRSTDGGLTYTNIGLIPGCSENVMPFAATLLTDGSVLFATAGNALGVGGAQIWKSVDQGLTWFLLTVLNDDRTAAVQPGGLKETHITATIIATGRTAEGRDGTATAAKWQTAMGKNNPQGDVFYSDAYDGYEKVTSWERFNAQSVPDAVTGVFQHRGLAYTPGPRSLEINYSSGDAEFPWAVSDPSLPYGLLAPNSWVSWDEADTIMYLTSTDKGIKVVQLQSRQQKGISQEYDQILNDRTIITEPQNAKAWAITIRGLRFYVISFQADDLTLIYNLDQDHWARWAYWNGTSYEAALINAYCYSNEQKRHFFGDRRPTGKIFTMDLTDLTDDGQPIVFEYTSGHVSRGGDSAKLPARYLGRYKRGYSIDATVPEVLLSWRNDGRGTFSAERVLSLGEAGDLEFYVHANRLGMYRLRQWRQRAFLTKCRLIFSGADES